MDCIKYNDMILDNGKFLPNSVNAKVTKSENTGIQAKKGIMGAFLSDLTALSVKHGIAISGSPVLFVMEPEDYPYAYSADEESNLSLR